MPLSLSLLLAVALVASCAPASEPEPSPNPSEATVIKTVRMPWSVTVTGTITRIERQNVDKTLRNPKWFVDIYVEPTKVEAPEGKTVVGEVQFMAKESELLPMLDGTSPKEGDQFVGIGRTTDDQSNVFELTGAELP